MNILFRLLELIISFVAGKSSGIVEQSQVLSAQVVKSIRQMVIVLLVAFGALTIFCSTFAITLNYLYKAIDAQGGIIWSPIFTIGILLCLISLFIFIACLRAKTWRKIISREPEEEKITSASAPSPIEQAVGLLIQDFVQERQHNREAKKNSDN